MQPTTLEQLRTKIASRHVELNAIENAGPSREERQQRIASYFQRMEDEGKERLKWAVVSEDFGSAFNATIYQPDGTFGVPTVSIQVLAALLGAKSLTAATCQHLSTVPEALDTRARAARITETAQELNTLERAEEDEVSRMEAQGVPVARRADARPEIVLAITDPDAIDADDLSRDLLPSNGLVPTAQRPNEPRLPRATRSAYMQRNPEADV